MESPVVRLTPSALQDLRDVLEWHNEQEVPEVGKKKVDALFMAMEELSSFPAMGRIVPEFASPNLRELIRPPYRIVYKLDGGSKIWVVRVWRSERMLRLP